MKLRQALQMIRLLTKKLVMKKKQSFEPEVDDVLNKALAVLDKGSDVLDVFGEFVAGELRQMVDPVLRISTKRERMQVLIHYGKFNNQNPTQTTSNFDYSIQSQPNVHSTKHAITSLWSFRPTIHVNSCRTKSKCIHSAVVSCYSIGQSILFCFQCSICTHKRPYLYIVLLTKTEISLVLKQ